MPDETYTAALFDTGASIWKLTDDTDSIINADNDKLIFVETIEDLVDILKQRYDTELLHYVDVFNGSFDGKFAVSILSVPRYKFNGEDPQTLAKAAELVKNGQRLTVCGKFRNYASYHDANYAGNILDKFHYGYVSYYVHELIYDPTIIAVKKRNSTPKPTKYIKLNEIANVTWAMRQACNNVLETHLDFSYCRNGVIGSFAYRLQIFTEIFGKNAHRYLKQFQELCKRFKEEGAKAQTFKIADKISCDITKKHYLKFFTWLDGQANKRFYKPKVEFTSKKFSYKILKEGE